MPPKDKYTDPKLRDEIKEELMQGDKGGAPGQWSARKAQMMASEYKKRGGSYNIDKDDKDESQKNLEKWGEEDWQTKEGSGEAKQEDGSRKRYLPKKAWEQMGEKEKKETDKKKAESRDGKQFVDNTDKAKKARKNASKEDDEAEHDTDRKMGKQKSSSKKGAPKNGASKEDAEKQEKSDEEASIEEREDDADSQDDKHGSDTEAPKRGQKRKANSKQSEEPDKKAQKKDPKASEKKSGKTFGSRHDDADASKYGQQGSNDRLPKKGQDVHWKAMPGFVDGKVVEVLKRSKSVDGKSVKASEEDPKIVLKSNSSGKICVHKPSAVYF